MNVLHVVPTYLPATRYGGPIYAIHGLCKSLVEEGVHVSVYTTNVDGPTVSNVKLNTPVDIDGVQVTYFSSPYFSRLFYAPDMKLMLEDQIGNFDLLHGHSIYLWPTKLAARTCLKTKTPYVLSPRGMLVRNLVAKKNRILKLSWIKLVERKNISIANAVHFTSMIEANAAKSFDLDIKTSFVLPNGIDSKEIEQYINKKGASKPQAHDIPVILYLGRINWKKGLDRLIKSMALVKKAKLVIAGNDEEGYTEKLKKLIDQFRLNDRIEFTGPRYGLEKYSLFMDADVFVLPSYSENFGNAALESMALGCPVIVTSEVGLASKIEQTKSGIIVSGEPESIAEGINRLLDEQVTANEMGDNGRKTARNEFSWQFIAKQMHQRYQRIVASSGN